MKIIKYVIIIILLFISFFSLTKSEKNNTYWVSEIDSTIFCDYYLLVLNRTDSLECEKIIVSNKNYKFEENENDYATITVGSFLNVLLKLNDSLKTERYSLKSISNNNYNVQGKPDSLMPFTFGFPPCMQIIWENGSFTDNVYVFDDIKGLYVKKELIAK